MQDTNGSLVKFDFNANVGGQEFLVQYIISGFDGSWVGFNPQPDPPGFGGDTVGFAFQGDPAISVEIFALDANGDILGPVKSREADVAEPGTLALLGTGTAGLSAIVRRRLKR